METKSLRNSVTTLLLQIPGKKAVVIEDLKTGESIEINQEEKFPAASLIKLPILFKFYCQVIENPFLLKERIKITPDCRVVGFGILKDLEDGLNPTFRDLAVLMITLSDNIATNLLIDKLGMNAINNEIRVIGMMDTSLKRKMMDIQAKARGLDNETSARDIQKVLKAILKSPMREEILDILFRQQCNNKLPALMGSDIRFAHKTGDLPGIEHDAGIIYAKGKEILVIVLTKELADNREGIRLNQEIGRLIYNLI